MVTSRRRSSTSRFSIGRLAMPAIGVAWTAAILFILSSQGFSGGIATCLAVIAALGVTLVAERLAERHRWVSPLQDLATEVRTLAGDPEQPLGLASSPELEPLVVALSELRTSWLEASRLGVSGAYYREMIAGGSASSASPRLNTSMTRSGMLAAMPDKNVEGTDVSLTGDFSTTDMVNRLEPDSLRWIESSLAEQQFLGWDLATMREKSLLDVIHADDHARVRERVVEALEKGEAHGLIVRVRTAQGKPKAIEINIGVRYGPDRAVTHLRCHLTDVTDRIRSERELKLRTRELTQVNEQLRQINRELEELKDRYRDLYQNAPAMYYSLDPDGRFHDCNETLLQTLGYRRADLVGRPFVEILAEPQRSSFATRYAEFRRVGSLEVESKWLKANGEPIDVWVSATAVRGRDGKFLLTRSVAQDVTARHRLEAELKEKNERLARTNDELSRKNREMDEFAYVVSHDLQEPLRTLNAFSDFLMKDYGERLDANGQEYVRYLVEASRRMRALIHGLLHLSRAGKVTGEFEPVNLEDVLAVVKADLRELLRSKNAEIRTAGPLPTLWGDRDRIGQLVANLVGNGLKYNQSEEPWVEVGTLTQNSGPWATFYIRDNGIGIDPQFHTRIFQLFRRLHTREEYEGTGAGLAICQKIVQAHGGRLWVESTPNEGATFFVSLNRPPLEDGLPSPPAQVTHAS